MDNIHDILNKPEGGAVSVACSFYPVQVSHLVFVVRDVGGHK